MKKTSLFWGGLLSAALGSVAFAGGYTGPLVETPSLASMVDAGDLPPVAERVPAEPLVVDMAASGRTTGAHGGTLRTFVSRSKDIRYMSAWGYARLVGYDTNYALVPDILRDYEVSEDGSAITLHLREGHRWSDGAPFTTEDLRYWWEDVALNADLSPAGPPVEMLVNGEAPVVTVVDDVTITFDWPQPNPRFLPALAQARPVYIYRPSHYVKQFHEKYAEPAALTAAIEAFGKKTWAALHNNRDNLYKNDNPDLPMLQPWLNQNKKNSQRYVLNRNPYYHRVDSAGHQLPYIDTVELEIAASGLVPLKASLGEASMQIRGLGFANAPALKKNEDAHGYKMQIWRSGSANEVAIYPNLNYSDEIWAGVMRDVRFRRALSIGINRKEINKVLYYGIGKPAAVAALEESPFYDKERARAYTKFSTKKANALLDEMGLTERDSSGLRLLPDGRPMKMVIETAGERSEVNDTLELVAEGWKRLGIQLSVKPQDRDVLRNRAFAGQTMMVAWYGWNVGVPTSVMAPSELAPVDQATFSWPKWGQYYQTKGSAGEAPDLPEAQRLMDLFAEWTDAPNEAIKSRVWQDMLDVHADQVFVIGTIARAPVPVVHNAALKNVPVEGIYAWDPGAQVGVHRMDAFYFEN